MVQNLSQESSKADAVKIDNYSRVTISEQEAFEAIYNGKLTSLEGVVIDCNIDQYNNAVSQNADRLAKLQVAEDLTDVSVKMFDESNQCDWFMPKDAVQENLVEMLYGMCETEEQTDRVSLELKLFIQHGMFDLLFYLKYLVDTMRQNNIVWGVGRGSSVASYVLFLIGVHKIDSIKYDLDIKEFLKENQNEL
jgi:DNA polymerase III alpha subunit